MAAIMKLSPWALLRELQDDVNLKQDSEAGNRWFPAVDIWEEGSGFTLVADLPGVDPKADLKISVEENVLTLKGVRNLKDIGSTKNSRRERFAGSFSRSFTLPKMVDSERIQAKVKNGVLEIFIPKSEPHVPKQIEVKVEE